MQGNWKTEGDSYERRKRVGRGGLSSSGAPHAVLRVVGRHDWARLLSRQPSCATTIPWLRPGCRTTSPLPSKSGVFWVFPRKPCTKPSPKSSPNPRLYRALLFATSLSPRPSAMILLRSVLVTAARRPRMVVRVGSVSIGVRSHLARIRRSARSGSIPSPRLIRPVCLLQMVGM